MTSSWAAEKGSLEKASSGTSGNESKERLEEVNSKVKLCSDVEYWTRKETTAWKPVVTIENRESKLI